jgi:hypothetical protein
MGQSQTQLSVQASPKDKDNLSDRMIVNNLHSVPVKLPFERLRFCSILPNNVLLIWSQQSLLTFSLLFYCVISELKLDFVSVCNDSNSIAIGHRDGAVSILDNHLEILFRLSFDSYVRQMQMSKTQLILSTLTKVCLVDLKLKKIILTKSPG